MLFRSNHYGDDRTNKRRHTARSTRASPAPAPTEPAPTAPALIAPAAPDMDMWSKGFQAGYTSGWEAARRLVTNNNDDIRHRANLAAMGIYDDVRGRATLAAMGADQAMSR